MQRHKKCVWKDYNAELCNRCVKLGIACNSMSVKSITPTPVKTDTPEMQDMWTTIEQLGTEMQQLEVMKASLVTKQQPPHMEWQLSITNGVLKLETPIQTIEELVMFSQASMRYLSPFSGLFNKQPIQFESKSISLTHGLSYIMHRHEMLKPRRKRFEILGYNDNNQIIRRSTHTSRSTIDYLVSMYLRHYNNAIGMLHQPTFPKYYQDLDDPWDSALALAVCVDALARIRHLLVYSPDEACILSEVFYSRCKDLLFDMYEDQTQRLQIVVVTSLLLQYLSDVLLNHLEANRLATVALLICADLENCVSRMTPVERILFQRNYFHIKMSDRSFKMLYEDKIDFTKSISMPEMEVLDDEPEKTKWYVCMVNNTLRFLGSRYISDMMAKVNRIFLGQSCDILMEDVLRYQPLVLEWWNSLPQELRLCEDPFDPHAYKFVEGKVAPNTLLPFTILHIVTGIFSASILQPKVTPTSETVASPELVQLIRKNSIALAINSCKVLVYSLKENWDPYTSDMPSGKNFLCKGVLANFDYSFVVCHDGCLLCL
ncbi:hypothetical protein BJV82DRAFT_606935 [Fennellomyces sp. T-0311]|nr:hypothetical protein BJV82DRAFT_606935 [Fennellomyces sp. T-0311]